MTSSKDLLVTKGSSLKKIKQHPGHIMVMGAQGDVYIVNVYIMSILKHFMYDFQGCVQCVFKNKYFALFGMTNFISYITYRYNWQNIFMER